MINILKLKDRVFEVIKFELNYDEITASEILVKMASEEDMALEKETMKRLYDKDGNMFKSDYASPCIAIVDNIQYNITEAYLGGFDNTIDIKNAYLGFSDITWKRLENNYSGLTEEDRNQIRSLEGLKKYNL